MQSVQSVQLEVYRLVYTRTQSGLTSMRVTPARLTNIFNLLTETETDKYSQLTNYLEINISVLYIADSLSVIKNNLDQSRLTYILRTRTTHRNN